ncbi:MAG TPA: nitrilase-related carbon-nitrogen hydrolase, partial [Verrucomicrobiota bacterium]|nr:nitrilase-related carbon-nitrogen hydrolase [Verrucomicrobiota bacterium]
MKIAIAQINTTIGDFEGNFAKISDAYKRGVESGVSLVLTPEMALTGYPPRDLLLRKDFVEKNLSVLDKLKNIVGKVGLVVGYVDRNSKKPGRDLTNSVAIIQNNKILATRSKTLLPTYDVFDEDRYFEPATENLPVVFNDEKIGLTICEDIWNDEDFWRDRRYRRNPPEELFKAGAELLINISASPWHLGKNKTRQEMLMNLSRKFKKPVIYCNLVGGNDELVFDGGSMAYNENGEMVAYGSTFKEDFLIADINSNLSVEAAQMPNEEYIYRALVIGLRDYVYKCGFKSVVLGLSGGIDSAITACMAAEAVGNENVMGVSLPSQFSSKGSL